MSKEVRSVQAPPLADLAWSDEQNQVISAPKTARLLVEAGPGTGKTAVACARVAALIADGSAIASKILVISFTRTAVREIRDRIFAMAKENPDVARVKITTIDSHSWGLRNGFEEEADSEVLKSIDYHSNLERLCNLLDEKRSGLIDFLSELDHVIVDEGQDVVGTRARMLRGLVRVLDKACGVTVFLDPAQAIYGFTNERGGGGPGSDSSFVHHVSRDKNLGFKACALSHLFRTSDKTVRTVFEKARELVVPEPSDGAPAYDRLRARLLELAKHDAADRNACDLNGRDDALVLFRHRSEVLRCSSFLSSAGVEHRLRLSGLPTVVRPWIGRLLGQCSDAFLTRTNFDGLWANRVGELFLGQPTRDQAWAQLRRLAGDRSGRVEMRRLRQVLARPRPPIEICSSEVGYRGPIVGTIHASKGREADLVRLTVPKLHTTRELTADEWHEEARVLYVGATRARQSLEVQEGGASYVSYLSSGRAYSTLRKNGADTPRAQVQLGLADDVDHWQQLCVEEPDKNQDLLANLAGKTQKLMAYADPEDAYRYRIQLDAAPAAPVTIGFLRQNVNEDLFMIAKALAKAKGTLKPWLKINHLYLSAVTTVAIGEDADVQLPHPYAESRIYLAPVIRGYSVVGYAARKKGA